MRQHVVPASLATLVLASCASAPPAVTPPPPTVAVVPAPIATPPPAVPHGAVSRAVANVAPASGTLVSGRLALAPMGDGVHITGDIGGLVPNSVHGFHIHETGDCSAADASSAGGHYNPAGMAHGRANTMPHHAGDIDNIVADGNGVAHVDAHVPGVVLGGDPSRDILGRALVVHAAADDYRTQPSGASGARVACGVISPLP
jgi:Cu-Zn family superoxide dismutase